jgi:hypothetical protein
MPSRHLRHHSPAIAIASAVSRATNTCMPSPLPPPPPFFATTTTTLPPYSLKHHSKESTLQHLNLLFVPHLSRSPSSL